MMSDVDQWTVWIMSNLKPEVDFTSNTIPNLARLTKLEVPCSWLSRKVNCPVDDLLASIHPAPCPPQQ
jgi:hypothetical protein